MVWESINGVNTWVNWTSYLTNSTSNNTDIVGGIVKGINSAPGISVFWYFAVYALYMVLLIAFKDTPAKYRWPGIAFIVAIVALMFAWSGYITDAAGPIIIFGVALLTSRFFNL